MQTKIAGLFGASVLACALGCGSSDPGAGTGGSGGGAASAGHGATAGFGGHAGTGANAGFGGTGAHSGSGGVGGEGAGGAGGSAAGGFGGSAAGGSGGSGGTTNCTHDLCAQGGPLAQGCDPCVGTVCSSDSYCCQSAWDDICISEASAYCNDLCGSGGFGGGFGGAGGFGGYGGSGGSGGGGGCSSVTCASGCCDASGTCVTSHANDKCGLGGTTCVDCTAQGSVCSEYNYKCAECKPDCTGKQCGAADGCGGVCDGACPSGQFCSLNNQYVTNGCQTCNALSCPYGCCSADGQCVGGGDRHACGGGGKACTDCGSQACVSDTTSWPFTSKCGACGSGCQPQYPGMPAMCQSDGCGALCPGAGCDQSYGNQTCTLTDQGAMCMSDDWCDPYQCASGCCDYSGGGWFSGGKCVTGNLPSQCGHGGVQCVDCVAQGGSCDTTAKSCTSCTPKCDAAWSCGQADGCGGTCTSKNGGKCQGTGAACDDKGVCGCTVSGQALCYDSSTSTSSCIDVQSDANNCGACGAKCPSGVACSGGQCQCPSGSLFCASSTSGSAGDCTNLGTDPEHCGSCTNQCPGTVCTGGKCGACPAGQTKCGYTNPICADTQTDTQNCGACSNVCPSGIACVGGACQCPGGQTSCNAKCTDLQTDAKNCGQCYTACPTGVACAGGQCQCPAGTTLCGSSCTNLTVDPMNCGTCGNSCSSGFCNNGTCI
jgi:hypothetical protein